MKTLFKYKVLLSDNKPPNILIKYDETYTFFHLYLTDFGGSYMIGREKLPYPKFLTNFYFNEDLYEKKQVQG